MHLKNSFTDETRELWFFRYDCDICRRNKDLELHHILGRISNSPLNASMICRKCHNNNAKLSTFDTKKNLLHKTLKYLLESGYKLTEQDKEFIRKNEKYYKDFS